MTARWAGSTKQGEAWGVPFGYSFEDDLPTIPRGNLPSRSVVFDTPTALDLSSAVSFSLNYWDGPVLIVSDADIKWTIH